MNRTKFLSALFATILMILVFQNCSKNKPLGVNLSKLVIDTSTVFEIAAKGGVSPPSYFIHVDTDTKEPVDFTFSHNSVWIQLQNASGSSAGTTPDSFFVKYRISVPFLLDVGEYTDVIEIKSNDVANPIVTKTINISIGSEIKTTPESFEFEGAKNGNNPLAQYLTIASTSSRNYSYTISTEASWINIPITNSVTSRTDSIPITINLAGLVDGVFTDSIKIESDGFMNSPYYIKCKVSVSPWLLQESPLLANLLDIYFTDELNGWVVGFAGNAYSRNGIILNTINGGNTWTKNAFLDGPDSSMLGAVQFINDTGWVCGENGLILKTIDNGQSWDTLISGMTNPLTNLNNLSFVNSSLGWIVGDGGVILKTVDGGLNWLESIQDTEFDLYGITFVDELNGWTAGQLNVIFHTSDGGDTWLTQQVDPPPGSNNSYDFNEIFFTDINHGWAVGKLGYIIYTTDGGAYWSVIQLENLSKLSCVYFVDNQTGWIGGQNGTLMKTVNGGLSWSSQFSNTEYWIVSMHFISATQGWGVGQMGTIIVTSSGGEK